MSVTTGRNRKGASMTKQHIRRGVTASVQRRSVKRLLRHLEAVHASQSLKKR